MEAALLAGATPWLRTLLWPGMVEIVTGSGGEGGGGDADADAAPAPEQCKEILIEVLKTYAHLLPATLQPASAGWQVNDGHTVFVNGAGSYQRSSASGTGTGTVFVEGSSTVIRGALKLYFFPSSGVEGPTLWVRTASCSRCPCIYENQNLSLSSHTWLALCLTWQCLPWRTFLFPDSPSVHFTDCPPILSCVFKPRACCYSAAISLKQTHRVHLRSPAESC